MDSLGSSAERPIDWSAVWRDVAKRLSADELAPKFLTEDGIRSATLRVLQAQIDVVRFCEIERLGRTLGGGHNDRLDLVVQERASITVVEFKYPREPRQTLPPWPDHFGSYLADTYRLGVLAASGQVQHTVQLLVSGAGFLGYVERTVRRLGLGQYHGDNKTPESIRLTPTAVAGLAPTTRKSLRRYEQLWVVEAEKTAAFKIAKKSLWLAAYNVRAKEVADGRSGT